MEQEQINKQETEIDLGALLYALWKHIGLIIITTLLCGAIMFVYNKSFVTPLYQSTASVFVLNRTNEESITSSDISSSTALTKDFADLTTSHLVVDRVISDLGLENYSYSRLRSNINVSIEDNSRMLRVTVSDPDPEMAKKLVDAVVDVLVDAVADRVNMNINKIDEGTLPEAPSSPNITKRTILGCAIGAVIAIAIIVITFLLDDTLKTDVDVEKYLQLTVLASIPLESSTGEYSSKKKKASRKRGGRRYAAR